VPHQTQCSCSDECLLFWTAKLLEKLLVTQLVKKFLAFHGTRSFVTVFTRARPLPSSCVTFRNMLCFYGEELLAPSPIPKLEDHPLFAVRDSYPTVQPKDLKLISVSRLLITKLKDHPVSVVRDSYPNSTTQRSETYSVNTSLIRETASFSASGSTAGSMSMRVWAGATDRHSYLIIIVEMNVLITTVGQVMAPYYLSRLRTKNAGSNPTRGMDCVRVFLFFLATDRSHIQVDVPCV
jgi:hypothetical protein